MLIDELGCSVYDMVKYATYFVYLEYRIPDRFFHTQEFGKLDKRIARANDSQVLNKDMYKALDYMYKFGLIVTGRFFTDDVTEQEMLDALNQGKDSLVGYNLKQNNHDGFIIYSERGKYYHLLHGDGNYWLFEIAGQPDIAGYNAANRWDELKHTKVRFPRIVNY